MRDWLEVHRVYAAPHPAQMIEIALRDRPHMSFIEGAVCKRRSERRGADVAVAVVEHGTDPEPAAVRVYLIPLQVVDRGGGFRGAGYPQSAVVELAVTALESTRDTFVVIYGARFSARPGASDKPLLII